MCWCLGVSNPGLQGAGGEADLQTETSWLAPRWAFWDVNQPSHTIGVVFFNCFTGGLFSVADPSLESDRPCQAEKAWVPWTK